MGNAITPLLRAETLCALFFPPVEKRLSLPPRLTPLSTNNFVRCTLQNRIIKKSVLEGLKEKTKNNQNNTSFKLHMKKKQNNNKFFLATKQTMFVYDILPLPHYFSLIQKFT